MGFCYDSQGLLCCDFCGKSGEVRKIACPYNWCQHWATCADCRHEGKHHVASCGGGGTHAEVCKQASADFKAGN